MWFLRRVEDKQKKILYLRLYHGGWQRRGTSASHCCSGLILRWIQRKGHLTRVQKRGNLRKTRTSFHLCAHIICIVQVWNGRFKIVTRARKARKQRSVHFSIIYHICSILTFNVKVAFNTLCTLGKGWMLNIDGKDHPSLVALWGG